MGGVQAWRPGTTRADLEDEQHKANGPDTAAPGDSLPDPGSPITFSLMLLISVAQFLVRMVALAMRDLF